MKNAEKIEHLQQVAEMLLCKVESRLKDTAPEDLPPQTAKHVSATLKDIRDIQQLKLDNEDRKITLVVEGEMWE